MQDLNRGIFIYPSTLYLFIIFYLGSRMKVATKSTPKETNIQIGYGLKECKGASKGQGKELHNSKAIPEKALLSVKVSLTFINN